MNLAIPIYNARNILRYITENLPEVSLKYPPIHNRAHTNIELTKLKPRTENELPELLSTIQPGASVTLTREQVTALAPDLDTYSADKVHRLMKLVHTIDQAANPAASAPAAKVNILPHIELFHEETGYRLAITMDIGAIIKACSPSHQVSQADLQTGQPGSHHR